MKVFDWLRQGRKIGKYEKNEKEEGGGRSAKETLACGENSDFEVSLILEAPNMSWIHDKCTSFFS